MWTSAEVINFILAIAGILGAAAAWYRGRAEKDKLEAETALLYANISNAAAKREKQLYIDIGALENKIDAQDKRIVELKEIIEKKDNRIHDLETLTVAQEKEIGKLRTELNALRKNIK